MAVRAMPGVAARATVGGIGIRHPVPCLPDTRRLGHGRDVGLIGDSSNTTIEGFTVGFLVYYDTTLSHKYTLEGILCHTNLVPFPKQFEFQRRLHHLRSQVRLRCHRC